MKRSAILKKITVLSLAIVCLLTYYGYTMFNDQRKSQGSSKVFSQCSYTKEIKSIDDVAGLASNIIVGTVIGKEDFSDYTDKFIVSVDRDIKGTTHSTNVDVYEAKETFEVGSKYLLFLEYSESVLYPNPKYTSVYKECIIKVADDNSVENSAFVDESMDLDKLIKVLEKSEKIALKPNRKYNIKNKYETIEEQIDDSDHILIVYPENIIKYNKYVSLVKVTPEVQLKGDITGELDLLLPADIQKGKKYIVFLKKTDNNLELASREGSIISEDQAEKWEQISKKLKNNN